MKISYRLWEMDRKQDKVHTAHFSLRSLFRTAGSACVILLCMLLILLAGLSSAPGRNWADWGRHEKQYEEMTAALAAGSLALTEEPAPFLAEMDNPYDPAARSIASDEAGAYALIDTAYYHGRYYVYFGLTPALLLYLPVYLLTGRLLPTWIAVILTAVLCVPAVFVFLRCLCARYAPKTPAGIRLLLGVSLTGILGLPYLAAFCTTYSMPAVTGILLTLAGLSCFLTAPRPDGSFRRPLLAAGSVLLGLSVGCRPVFGASFLLLFALYGREIRSGAFFRPRKESLTNTVAVLLPALLTGSIFLVHNALRFGSPFEFGFRYLFTTRDLLHGRHSAGEILEGARLLFLNPPVIRRVFPFMEIADYAGPYRDTLYVEPLFGGLLPLHPLLPAGAAAGLFLLTAACLTDRRARAGGKSAGTETASRIWLSLLSFALGAVILFLDAGIAGISQRYESDFALFFFLPAVFAFLPAGPDPEAGSGRNAKSRRIPGRLLTVLLLILTLTELFLSFAGILCDGRYFAMRDWNPDAYNRIAAFFH